jgi:hypothetical protein
MMTWREDQGEDKHIWQNTFITLRAYLDPRTRREDWHTAVQGPGMRFGANNISEK